MIQLYIYRYILLYIHFHYDLSQDIEYSSLCYAAVLCCLSILYITVLQPQTPSPSFSPSLWQLQVCSLCLRICFYFTETFTYSLVPYFRFHIKVISYICLSLSDWLCIVWSSLGPSMLLQMALFHPFHVWVIFHCTYTI